MIEILSSGSGMTIQDAGRGGWRRFGVPTGGAMDPLAMSLSNLLLGNQHHAPVLEIAQQGARIRILENTWIGLGGGDFCRDFASGTALPVRQGQLLEFSKKSAGMYTYLSLPGGFKSELWLGSAATDIRNGMGVVIHSGSRLASCLLQPKIPSASVARRSLMHAQTHLPQKQEKFELYPGPQFDAFSLRARQQFISNTWIVSMRSDRTGYRLEGPKLAVPASIASEPVLPGSFQIPGNGQPIITMLDGPTVGGYAKIAVIATSDLGRLAQCAPGTQLCFSWKNSL